MGRSTPEGRAEYAVWYRNSESGKAARKRAQDKYRGSDKWREAHRRGTATYRAKSKVRRSAWDALNDAVRYGKIRPPTECERCEKPARLHAHHHNGYEKPHHLDVRWICGECHRIEHPLGRPKKGAPLIPDPVHTE